LEGSIPAQQSTCRAAQHVGYSQRLVTTHSSASARRFVWLILPLVVAVKHIRPFPSPYQVVVRLAWKPYLALRKFLHATSAIDRRHHRLHYRLKEGPCDFFVSLALTFAYSFLRSTNFGSKISERPPKLLHHCFLPLQLS
jgi:hypothetical protein